MACHACRVALVGLLRKHARNGIDQLLALLIDYLHDIRTLMIKLGGYALRLARLLVCQIGGGGLASRRRVARSAATSP
jgi:hypothetical protein